jgi:uncharacterized protein YaiL (DUF2058 family)
MGDSLRDQLLALGLAKKPEPRPHAPQRPAGKPGKGAAGAPDKTGKSAAGAVAKQAPSRSGPPHGGAKSRGELDLAQAYAARARIEREERQRAEQEAQQKARERKERKLKLAAALEGKALNAADADVARHFDHAGKIRRVYVTAEQLPRLNRGELGVVQMDGRYLIVARDTALAVQAISPESLLLLPDPNAPPEDDIPPDLVW